MRNIFINCIIITAFLFLLFAFYSADFNIKNWNQESRFTFCLMEFCVIFAYVTFEQIVNKD